MSDQRQANHIRDANTLFNDALIYVSPARDSELQKQEVHNLETFMICNASMKAAAVARRKEDFANVCLGLECVAIALRAEISMWLLLKQDNPDAAWGQLVTAQTALANAIKSHKTFDDLEDHVEHLDTLEKLVFPPQVYLSMGMVVHRETCSICEDDYRKCDHIAGRPYWGRFCYIILQDIVANEVSFVEEPANKHCRVTHFDDAGGQRNRMTWKLELNPDHTKGSAIGPGTARS